MAHAMFRISYTTIIMEKHYFAFVGKNPGGGTAASFCHVFRTDKKEDVRKFCFIAVIVVVCLPLACLWIC